MIEMKIVICLCAIFSAQVILGTEDSGDIAGSSLGSSAITRNMEEHQVVPDVLDAAPAKELEVKYGDLSVNLGNELTPTQVKDEPRVNWEADNEAYYTLCMTDPDAPSRKEPIRREFHHWLVGNIPGNKVQDGDVLTQYIGSGPPKGSGLHRYVFVLYKQPGHITFDETRLDNRSGTGRPNFSIRRFAEKYGLGAPIAGNFYQAQWDDYVPKLWQRN